MSRVLVPALAVFAFLQGCHQCLDNPRVRISFEFAKKQYDLSRFDEAKKLYSITLEECPDFYEGMLGLANACREYGSQLFTAVNELVTQRKPDQAQKLHQTAKENHAHAFAWFQKTMELNSRDERPHYGLGLLYYQRATSPVPYPYGTGDKGRQKERDLAIREFETCLEKVPSSYQAHRYLALALFAAGKSDEARQHLVTYHDFVQRTYDYIFAAWPSSAEEDKKRKEEALRTLEKEVSEVREVLSVYRDDLERRKKELEDRREGLKPEERQELARLTRELLEMEDILRSFSSGGGGPVEQALRGRCLDYLKCFNRQSLPECLFFLSSKPEEEAALRRKLQESMGQGTRYENFRFKSVVVSGDQGSVGITCDVVSRGGSKPGTELTFRWKMVAGLWRLVEVP
jgi:tetratricopeptide (TPR) repeat protein